MPLIVLRSLEGWSAIQVSEARVSFFIGYLSSNLSISGFMAAFHVLMRGNVVLLLQTVVSAHVTGLNPARHLRDPKTSLPCQGGDFVLSN